jgi:hypothetical protein
MRKLKNSEKNLKMEQKIYKFQVFIDGTEHIPNNHRIFTIKQIVPLL